MLNRSANKPPGSIIQAMLGTAIILLTLYMVVVQNLGNIKTPPVIKGLSQLRFSPIGERLLVIAPHPDDETLATGGLIQQALSEHRKVKVVIMTCGDGNAGIVRAYTKKNNVTPVDFRLVGKVRIRESKNALARLGLTEGDLTLLAYPDGGLNSLWDYNWDYDNLHRGLNGHDHAPYSFAYQKNAPYCGENVVKNLTSIINDYKPTGIVFPDTQDNHHDHWAANAFMQYVLTKTGYRANKYIYLVHKRDFPFPAGDEPSYPLDPPTAFARQMSDWESLRLSSDNERVKGEALAVYKIPALVKQRFIESFVRTNELVGKTVVRHVRRVNTPPKFDAPVMPYKTCIDPPSDRVRSSPGNSGDLDRVSFCISKNTAYAGVETAGNISDKIKYSFRMRIFGVSRVDQVDMEFTRGTVRCLRDTHNSLACGAGMRAHVLEKRIWIEFPSSIFNGKKALMYCVDSSMNRKLLDRVAWHTCQL
ncbi:MAG: hypothetical protein CVT63_01435 [Candidatus Anoxymicrobium japonicum]|uniref:LmbE family protein n=1 Tax=Candidatus Anoxymicrobium japonicum TaxID=2013648 RepID=A0A2N3G7I4_9ACTN|nr:MAG: hypothetical protein CVT63_01435 [Candidatus Anoxymicrobium japonicum]